MKVKNRLDKAFKIFKKEYSDWLFLLPFILGFFIFVAYPIFVSLFYSFTDHNGIRITKTGLFNYADIFDFSRFGMGKEVWRSFGLTGLYAIISIPLSLVLSYTLALFLKKEIPAIRTIRLLCYLPVLVPGIVAGQIWIDMLSYDNMGVTNGIINQMFIAFGLAPKTFFSAADTQFATLIFIGQWGIGGGMIVWLAALNNISPALYEAADIDGAGYFTKLFKITLPMSSPIIFYNLIGTFIGCLQTFDSYAYIGRGMEDATYFISIRIYVTAFANTVHQYGLACAMAWILFAFIGILTIIMFKTSKWVFYGDEA